MNEHNKLIESFREPDFYPHAVDSITVRETHISSIVLTGPYAYKIKKPVQFSFLDFSTLEKRHHFCQQELELNQRLCPDLYLDVLPISGTVKAPRLNDDSSIIEYAVKMVQFPEENLLHRLAETDSLTEAIVDDLADEIVDFHATIDDDPPGFGGTYDSIKDDVRDNFDVLETGNFDQSFRERLRDLREWSTDHLREHKPTFKERREKGFVRNCHGDMHLGNIVLFRDEIKIFDCIEFNENFRWIDVINELAFLLMDLRDRGYRDLENRLLNRYLSRTGDYSGLKLLDFYRVYRALVRSKVNFLENDSGGSPGDSVREYLTTAESFLDKPPPVLFITHGFSGSGKTTFTQTLLQELEVIRIRSDVERKRLAGIPFKKAPAESEQDELYSEEMTKKTYGRLEALAGRILDAGFCVVVDATFLKKANRKIFRRLAKSKNVPFRILDFDVDTDVLEKRLKERNSEGDAISDADRSVLNYQKKIADPLTEPEQNQTIRVHSNMDPREIRSVLQPLTEAG